MIRAGFIRPLAGKTIVLAGRFRVLSDGDVCRLAENSGATCQESINESTDLVVIGDESKPAARAKTETSAGGEATTLKEEAESRKAGGQQIRVVSEAEFLSLVDSRAT